MAATEIPEFSSTWLVVTHGQRVHITARVATLSGGALIFREGAANSLLIKVFEQGDWTRVEMIDDPYGNVIVTDLLDAVTIDPSTNERGP